MVIGPKVSFNDSTNHIDPGLVIIHNIMRWRGGSCSYTSTCNGSSYYQGGVNRSSCRGYQYSNTRTPYRNRHARADEYSSGNINGYPFANTGIANRSNQCSAARGVGWSS